MTEVRDLVKAATQVRSAPEPGTVVLVTGASRGLGRAVMASLAQRGATVVGLARDAAGLGTVRDDICSAGGAAYVYPCDVTKADEVESVVSEVTEAVGPVDVLLNNAGIANPGPFLDASVADIRQVYEVNVLGVALMTRAVGRSMVQRRRGKVINIGSVDSVVGVPNLVGYCTSKGAVAQFTRALSAEWARYGVTVNCLCPGYFYTDINTELLEDPNTRDKILARVPLRRFARLEEIVEWVSFLSSSAADYATGQLFIVDGGESAR